MIEVEFKGTKPKPKELSQLIRKDQPILSNAKVKQTQNNNLDKYTQCFIKKLHSCNIKARSFSLFNSIFSNSSSIGLIGIVSFSMFLTCEKSGCSKQSFTLILK